jgi:hypothetical protein
MTSRRVSAPTDCPRCLRDSATLLLDELNALSVTYRCLHCSHEYGVLTGDLPEIIRAVARLLLQARDQDFGAELTWTVH